jgi:hypothetical protein
MLLLGALRAQARTEVSISTNGDEDIKVGSCFDALPTPGYAPVYVTINNHSGQARQWVLKFQSPGYYGNGSDAVESSFTVEVENNGTRTTDLLVPMAATNGEMPLQVSVSGYGADTGSMAMIGAQSGSGKTRTPFAVMSESLGTSIWSDLKKRIDDSGQDLVGSTVNPDDLPEDWRALSGVSGMWLRIDELNRLSPAQRDAIQSWVHAGGWLMLCGASEVPKDFQYAGFGYVRTLAAVDVRQAQRTIESELPKIPEDTSEFDNKTGDPSPELTEVAPNVPLLFSVVGIFAVVVGPLNVFVVSKQKRQRLFWTTPLISVCASALLMGMIVVQDGLGGHGKRSAVVCIFPGSRNEVIVQEQLSRTGLLLGSAFKTHDPVVLRQLDLLTSGQNPPARQFKNDGTDYSGQWFESRAAQAQRVVGVFPTRAEITLVNAGDVKSNGANPIIVSSFEATLDFAVYTDDQGHQWKGTGIQTGQKVTLQPAAQLNEGMPPNLDSLGGQSLKALSWKPGSFYATSTDDRDYVATLTSIHWDTGKITYVGPVTTTP